jgi:hypothetical protein
LLVKDKTGNGASILRGKLRKSSGDEKREKHYSKQGSSEYAILFH